MVVCLFERANWLTCEKFGTLGGGSSDSGLFGLPAVFVKTSRTMSPELGLLVGDRCLMPRLAEEIIFLKEEENVYLPTL